jgi:hypothetical protein
MPMQRLHHRDPRHHRVAAALDSLRFGLFFNESFVCAGQPRRVAGDEKQYRVHVGCDFSQEPLAQLRQNLQGNRSNRCRGYFRPINEV